MAELYDFQKETVRALLDDPQKHFVIATVGTGKGATSVSLAKAQCERYDKHKVLVITTASKVKATDTLKRNDFEQDADNFCGEEFRKNLAAFETVSWDSLHKWVNAHKNTLSDWVYIVDESAKGKTSTSRRGRHFQKIAKATPLWVGYTATPGDHWIDFEAYFQATGKVKTKTDFLRNFCVVQTFKGFPEITQYLHTDTLTKWWKDISYAPDTSKIVSELPKANYKVVEFRKPKQYAQVIKRRQKMLEDGSFREEVEFGDEDMIDNPSALCHYLRQICFTKEKLDWLKDFIEGLGEQGLFFYNYTQTADAVEEIAKKVLPKGSKVWRIDGAHHEIPAKDTIGKYDIVLAQWQSGAEGLNLQFMRVWVAIEMTYSYSTHFQAKGRVMRIGQDRPVFYYLLKTKGTIEDDMLKCLKDKRDFATDTWLIGNGLATEEEIKRLTQNA